MRIKTKAESMRAIEELGLNHFPEVLVEGVDEAKIKKFLGETKAEWYDIRDKTVSASPKARVVRFDEVIAYCKEADIKRFTVSISFRNYQKQHVCVGELNIHDDMVDYFLSNTVCSPRELLKAPDYSGSMSLFDRKLRYIKGLQAAVDYALIHELFNIIVEFWVFSCPVGLKNEKVVVRELRTDY